MENSNKCTEVSAEGWSGRVFVARMCPDEGGVWAGAFGAMRLGGSACVPKPVKARLWLRGRYFLLR